MKHIYLLVFACLLCRYTSAQFDSQYFDADTPNYYNRLQVFIPQDTLDANTWQIGRPQKAIFDSAATYPNALVTDTVNFYPVNDSSQVFLKVKVYPLYAHILAVRWKQKIDLDSAADYGMLEVSFDTGHTWKNAFDLPQTYNFYGFQPENKVALPDSGFAFSGTDTVWRDIWLCYPLYWLSGYTDTLLVRFTLKTDSVDNHKEGWLIDNMMAGITYVHTIAEIKSVEYLTVFPNPANDVLHVEMEKLMVPHIIEHMQLINALGQVVDEWRNEPTKFFIRTGKYPNGVYVLKVKTNIKAETKTVVIKHN